MSIRFPPRRLGLRAHRILGGATLCLVGLTGYALGSVSRGEDAFPYEVLDRRLVGDNGTSKDTLVKVPRGGPLRMQRKIEYHEADCERWYARRAVSTIPNAGGAFEVKRFAEVHDMQLPVDLSGEWQEWSETLPADFTCGPAYLAETVTAACTRAQKTLPFLRLRKPDIFTRFTVSCPGAPPG